MKKEEVYKKMSVIYKLLKEIKKEYPIHITCTSKIMTIHVDVERKAVGFVLPLEES